MNDEQKKAVVKLFLDWLKCKRCTICEHSSSIRGDIAEMAQEATEYARILEVELTLEMKSLLVY